MEGVPQGCPLSPLLLNFYECCMTKEVLDHVKDIAPVGFVRFPIAMFDINQVVLMASRVYGGSQNNDS